jgi:hypothetical protein
MCTTAAKGRHAAWLPMLVAARRAALTRIKSCSRALHADLGQIKTAHASLSIGGSGVRVNCRFGGNRLIRVDSVMLREVAQALGHRTQAGSPVVVAGWRWCGPRKRSCRSRCDAVGTPYFGNPLCGPVSASERLDRQTATIREQAARGHNQPLVGGAQFPLNFRCRRRMVGLPFVDEAIQRWIGERSLAQRPRISSRSR